MKKLFTLFLLLQSLFVLAQAPSNDNCENAVDFGVAPSCKTTVYNNKNATQTDIGTNNNPFCPQEGNVNHDVWFKFVASDTIFQYTISVKAAASNGIKSPNINMYRGGCGKDNLIRVCIDSVTVSSGEFTFNITDDLTPGENYWLRVSDNAGEGDFTVCVTEVKSLTIDQGSSNLCSGFLYDTGGPNSNYKSNENHVFKICPSDPSACIKLDFTYYNIDKAGDEITIYDGNSTSSPILAKLTGAESEGANAGAVALSLYAKSGCATITFKSDSDVAFEGFEMKWQCSPDECNPIVPIKVSASATPQDIINSVSANGALVKLDTIICNKLAYSTFSAGVNTDLGLGKGLILSSGRASDAGKINNATSTTTNIEALAGITYADADLDLLSSQKSRDACVVEFDVFASTDEINFEYIFGSEEYPEFVGADPSSGFNDIFAFFISGPGIVGDPGLNGKKNMAIIPGTNDPVAINSVNTNINWQYYRDNFNGKSVTYDGLTSDKLGIKKSLTARASVTPCKTYRLKMAVADRIDNAYDSGVFVSEIKGVTPEISYFSPNKIDYLIEKCSGVNDKIKIALYKPLPQATTFAVKVTGTATKDVDYTLGIPNAITFPAGVSELTFPILAIADNLTEGTETINITLSRDFGCGSVDLVTKSIRLTDQLEVKIEAGLDTIIVCANGEPKQIEASGATFYVWSPASIVNNPKIADPIIKATTSQYIYVIGQIGTCVAKDSAFINVFDPNVKIEALTDTEVCEGTPIILKAVNNTNNGNITWGPTFVNFDDPTKQTVKINSTFSTLVYVTTEKGGCVAGDTIPITVSFIGMPFFVAEDTTVCEGFKVQLASQTFSSSDFEWTPKEGLNNPNISNAIATPTKTTTYILTGTNANGTCTAKDTVVVTVKTNNVKILGSDTLKICKGDSIKLTATASGVPNGTNFKWTSKTAQFSTPSALTTKVNALKTGWIFAEFSGSDCLAKDSVFVIKDSLPDGLEIMAIKPDQPYCQGDTVLLYSNSILKPQYPKATFQWEEPVKSAISPLTNVNLLFLATKSGNYIRTIKNGVCIRRDTFNATVIPIIPPTGLKDTAICDGEKVQLNITNAKDYTKLKWEPATGLSCADCPNPIATSAGTYTFTGEVQGKCPAMAKVTISSKNKPLSLTPTQTEVCQGQAVNVPITITSTGVSNIKWSPSAGLSCTDCPNPTVTKFGTYTVEGIINTCKSSNTVTVKEADTLLIVAADGKLCKQANVKLELKNPNLTNIVWTPSANLSCSNCYTPTTSTPGIYTVTALKNGLCKASGKVEIQADAEPSKLSITPEKTELCLGVPIAVPIKIGTANVSNLVWTPATGLSCTNCPNPTATAFGTYKVTGKIGFCNAEGSVTITAIVDTLIQLTSSNNICPLDETKLEITNTDKLIDVKWIPNIGTGFSAIAKQAGIYTVTALKNGCKTSAKVEVKISPEPKAFVITPSSAVSICKDQAVNVPITVSNGTSLVWTPATGLSCNNCPNPIATAFGSYKVTGKIGLCNAEGKVDINSVTPDVLNFSVGKICEGSGSSAAVAIGNAGKFTGFTWTAAPGLTNLKDSTAFASQVGTFTVKAFSKLGNCPVTGSAVVTAGTKASSLAFTYDPNQIVNGNDQNINISITGTNIDLGATAWTNLNITGSNIQISSNDINGSIKTIPVKIKSADGCFTNDTAKVYKVIFPSVFTPEDATAGFENNKIFQSLPFGKDITMMELAIFNRWGVRVHHDATEKSPKTWNGFNDNVTTNAECPSDVYIYVAKFAPINAKDKVLTVKGQVTLLR